MAVSGLAPPPPAAALPPIGSLSPLRQSFRHFDDYYHQNGHNSAIYRHPESPLRRAVTPAVPDEELSSLLQSYLDQQHPRQQKPQQPLHHHRPQYKQGWSLLEQVT